MYMIQKTVYNSMCRRLSISVSLTAMIAMFYSCHYVILSVCIFSKIIFDVSALALACFQFALMLLNV